MNKHVAAAIALLAAPVAVMSGCSNQSVDEALTPTTTSGPASSAQKLTTQLNTAEGKQVANATVDFTDGFATVTVETVAGGILSPGFHGLHIHAAGRCEANSVASGGGPSGDFASAGDHFQAQGHTGQPASGDLPPLLVRSDGAGKLVATSDGFTEDQLKGPEGSSIVLHQDADMGTSSADSDQRLACGVLSPASAATTSISTSTSTSVVTTTTAVTTVPPATVTETTSPTAATTTTSVAPSTSTSTVTVIQPPSIPPITVPGPNGG